MTTYKAISSDSHIIEPHDLWEKRIDAPYRDRAPVLVREGEYHQWYCEGVPFGLIGINQQAGLRFEEPEKLTRDGSMDTIPWAASTPMSTSRTWSRTAYRAASSTPPRG